MNISYLGFESKVEFSSVEKQFRQKKKSLREKLRLETSLLLGCAVAVFGAQFGCSSCESPAESKDAKKQADPSAKAAVSKKPDDVIPYGRVEGRVHLAEGVKLAGPEPLAPELKCEPESLQQARGVFVDDKRQLQGALVTLTGFRKSPAPEPQEHTLDVRNCGLEPQLLVTRKGDSVKVTNHLDAPLIPLRGQESFARVLTKGSSRTWKMDKPGRFAVACRYGHPCGRAMVLALHHDKFAMTQKGGRFTIEKVPAGTRLIAHAWHPEVGKGDTELEVKAGKTSRVVIVLKARGSSDKQEHRTPPLGHKPARRPSGDT